MCNITIQSIWIANRVIYRKYGSFCEQTNHNVSLLNDWSLRFDASSLQFRLRKLIFILHSSRCNISAILSIRVTYSILLKGIKKHSPIYSTANKINILWKYAEWWRGSINKQQMPVHICIVIYFFVFILSIIFFLLFLPS